MAAGNCTQYSSRKKLASEASKPLAAGAHEVFPEKSLAPDGLITTTTTQRHGNGRVYDLSLSQQHSLFFPTAYGTNETKTTALFGAH